MNTIIESYLGPRNPSRAAVGFVLILTEILLIIGIPVSSFAAPARGAKGRDKDKQSIEAATRLQIFLDRAEFTPGKIDGHYGDFTLKALALYRQSRGGSDTPSTDPQKAKLKQEQTPDVSGLDLTSVDPVFTSYTVTEQDLKAVGTVASSLAAQAKQKSLPYQSAAEAIAEKFHTALAFLEELNPGKTKSIKAGDVLTVPNVEPFELTEVKDLVPGSQIAANDAEARDEPAAAKGKPSSRTRSQDEPKDKPDSPATGEVAVKVDIPSHMLTVTEGDKLIAAYPVTVGSEHTASPVGEWKVQAVAKLPNFRYDQAMLSHGQRSGNFYLLPPGPNNPVGILWIQLNKKGIGLHGTNDPDDIGRNASHGCVRLANWDIVRLAAKVKTGTPVSIH